ncbi:MAG: dolichyl-phosphate beta-glucosyltransferase [Chloroflexota bacterium]|nr:dolichyl-phosphate beta-glucosyltransferase [Chloroflexota bacterium]MEE2656444.1 dolichyl-phosphate beta-glucosyltransferase [Chloroflexota bacterium]
MNTQENNTPAKPLVEVVLPVYNEENDLPGSVSTLVSYLQSNAPWAWRILIADNASNDSTLAVATVLAENHPQVHVLHLDEKGRGRALKMAWLASDADVVCYMDVDLSTDLNALLPLVSAVLDDGYDVAIGSRLAKGAHVSKRTLKREIISRGYNTIIKLMYWTPISDVQCGFKALSQSAAQKLLPKVQDNAFFFDTELLLIAQKRGMSIHEVPVTWKDDPDSRVRLITTIMEDLRGLMRLRFGGMPRLD